MRTSTLIRTLAVALCLAFSGASAFPSAWPGAPICRFYARGTYAGAATTISPAWPAGVQAGDLGLLVIETANEVVTLTTPGDFTAQVADSPQGTGTAGGTAATMLTIFWGRAASSAPVTPVTSDPGDHVGGAVLGFRDCVPTGNGWDVTAGDVLASASVTVTIPGDTTTIDEELVLALVANATDSSDFARCSAHANADLQGLREYEDLNTTAGNGGGFCVFGGTRHPLGAYTATTATLATSSVQGRISLALKSVRP